MAMASAARACALFPMSVTKTTRTTAKAVSQRIAVSAPRETASRIGAIVLIGMEQLAQRPPLDDEVRGSGDDDQGDDRESQQCTDRVSIEVDRVADPCEVQLDPCLRRDRDDERGDSCPA